jgi:PAS domain S-box-containing protein
MSKRKAKPSPPVVDDDHPSPWMFETKGDAGQNHERYADLYRFAPVAYALLDRNGVIDEINQAGCDLFGTPVAALIGRPMVVKIAQPSRPAFLDHIRQARNTDAIVETELTIVTGDRRWVQVSAQTKRQVRHGRIMCWTTLVDLTDQQKAEEERYEAERRQRQAERDERDERAHGEAKDRFLAILSHELRTPLTPALLAIDQLSSEPLSPRVAELVGVVKRNIEIEAQLINDLLDVTRIARGRLDLALVAVDLHDVIRQAVDVCRPQAEARSISIGMDFTTAAHVVLGDPGRLRQVFWNLLINGIKFSAQGRIEIRTNTSNLDTIRVSISDHGIGMEEHTIAHLFQPFESRRQMGRRGLGLGLTICRGIVEAHQGSIRATSAGIGRGSTFEVEFPILATAVAGRTSTAEERPSITDVGRPQRVLLVEDDSDTAAMLSLLLSLDGHQVSVARTLAAARDKLAGGWDIVISDIGLPDGSGLLLAREVLDLSYRPKLIALSGFGSAKDVDASVHAGFDSHLIKPVDFDKLRQLLYS